MRRGEAISDARPHIRPWRFQKYSSGYSRWWTWGGGRLSISPGSSPASQFTQHIPFVPPACVAGIWKSHGDRRHHVDRLSGVNVVPKRSDPMSARPMGSASPELGSATGSAINFGCAGLQSILDWPLLPIQETVFFSLFFFFFFSFFLLESWNDPDLVNPTVCAVVAFTLTLNRVRKRG
jgi:hypothetical protein